MNKYFSNYVTTPLREKEDIIVLLLQTMKMFLVGDISGETDTGRVILRIDKMSRLFFETENKCFSINFPFNLDLIEIEQGVQDIRFYDFVTGIEFDQQILSVLLGLFAQNVTHIDNLDEFHYIFLTSDDEIGDIHELSKIWNLFKRLLLFEPGYLRYDYDPIHQNGHLHPLHHLDLYFSPSNTFKVGLHDRIVIHELIDILDIQTQCHYIKRV